MDVIIVLVIGLAVGSFLNVVIDRIPRSKNIFSSRSKCESCGKALVWYDLIPLLSYVLLRGKCRYCKADIPPRLFFVEGITGILFILTFILTSSNFNIFSFALSLIIISCFIAIFFVDFKFGIIPDQILITLMVAILIHHFLFNPDQILNFILTAFLSFFFFLIIFLATKGRGMGFGDVKFSFLIGFLLGFPNTILAFYISFLTGAAISLILIIWGKKKFRGDTIPFGPFLVFGTITTFFWGEKLLNSLSLFLFR